MYLYISFENQLLKVFVHFLTGWVKICCWVFKIWICLLLRGKCTGNAPRYWYMRWLFAHDSQSIDSKGKTKRMRLLKQQQQQHSIGWRDIQQNGKNGLQAPCPTVEPLRLNQWGFWTQSSWASSLLRATFLMSCPTPNFSLQIQCSFAF